MSIYKQLTTVPDRKCRSEVLLRLLLSTSYPQAALTDLTFVMAKAADIIDDHILENIAGTMQEIERSFTMFDFIRSIEIKRNGRDIAIIIKCMDVDPTARNLNDSTETHVVMATSNLLMNAPDATIVDPEEVAIKLMDIFYKSQVSYRCRTKSIQCTRWKHRTKSTKEHKSVDTNLDYPSVIKYLTASLIKRNFSIVLTQANILLQDQRCRIFSAGRK